MNVLNYTSTSRQLLDKFQANKMTFLRKNIMSSKTAKPEFSKLVAEVKVAIAVHHALGTSCYDELQLMKTKDCWIT